MSFLHSSYCYKKIFKYYDYYQINLSSRKIFFHDWKKKYYLTFRGVTSSTKKNPSQDLEKKIQKNVVHNVTKPSASSSIHRASKKSFIEHKPKWILFILAFGAISGSFFLLSFSNLIALMEGNEEDPDSKDSLSKVIEPISGTEFPVSILQYSDPTSIHWLLCYSLRCMMNFCRFTPARAYAYAIYISQNDFPNCEKAKTYEEIIEKILPERNCQFEVLMNEKFPSQYEPFSEETHLQNSEDTTNNKKSNSNLKSISEIDDSLLPVPYPSMVLRMVMLRSADGSHIANGFKKNMQKRINHFEGNKPGNGNRALREFIDFLESKKSWEKGTILEFIRLPEGYLKIRLNKENSSSITLKSEIFSYCLFHLYLGPKGYITSKEMIMTRIQALTIP